MPFVRHPDARSGYGQEGSTSGGHFQTPTGCTCRHLLVIGGVPRHPVAPPALQMRAIKIIDAPSIKIIDGMSSIWRVPRVPVASPLSCFLW